MCLSARTTAIMLVGLQILTHDLLTTKQELGRLGPEYILRWNMLFHQHLLIKMTLNHCQKQSKQRRVAREESASSICAKLSKPSLPAIRTKNSQTKSPGARCFEYPNWSGRRQLETTSGVCKRCKMHLETTSFCVNRTCVAQTDEGETPESLRKSSPTMRQPQKPWWRGLRYQHA